MKATLSKATWQDIAKIAKTVNPELAGIINKISPDSEHWLAKVSYPYGELIMKRSVLWLPNDKGDVVPITDSSLDSTIKEGLSYNLNSNPVSLVVKNSFEIFLPLDDRTIPLSGLITPGTAFGAWRILNPGKAENPAFIWDMTSGARSVFMMPKITETLRHNNLKNNYDINEDVPRSLIRHWDVFKSLANSKEFRQEWHSEIVYFSSKWFTHLDDPEWADFYNYFKKSSWGASEFWRNQPIYNLIFSLILNEYEGRPSPYAMDTAKYLVHMAMGALPGLAPARDSLAGPFEEIQRIYTEDYGLSYAPTILQPTVFDMKNQNTTPVYYSLNFPNALEFKPNKRQKTNLINDLREIKSLMVRYEKELTTDKFNVDHTTLSDVFKLTRFDYFHTASSGKASDKIRNSVEMIKEDPALRTTISGDEYNDYPNKVLFLNGCVRLSLKSQNI